MGFCLSKFKVKESDIDTVDYMPQGPEYDYLMPQRTIIVSLDNKWNIPIIDIDFDEWYENTVWLWPKNNAQRENFWLLERTPLPSPSVSSLDSSGFDTVF